MANDFLRRCLPYCLIWQSDGSWVVTNRAYKPIGFAGDIGWVEYGELPIGARFKNWSIEIARQLDHRGQPGEDRVYLYADSCIPTQSAQHWDAYQRRLKLLSELALV
jgi:hypothetical protein